MSETMQKIMIEYLKIEESECPYCKNNMYSYKEEPGVPPRCSPFCMECGFRSKEKKEEEFAAKVHSDSLKSLALNYFENGSIITDKALFNCTLESYDTSEEESLKARNIARRVVADILNDKVVHVLFNGGVGVGKSHLSMAIAKAVIEQSNYSKYCLFINYRELLEQLKFAMNDDQARKEITGSVMKEVKRADCVVLDDLGAELGAISGDRQATTYNIDTLTSILEARQNKVLIVTTNLNSKQIKYAYSDRVFSRILKNMPRDYIMTFEKTRDKRINM